MKVFVEGGYRMNTVQRKEKEVGILQEMYRARILLIKILYWLSVL